MKLTDDWTSISSMERVDINTREMPKIILKLS